MVSKRPWRVGYGPFSNFPLDKPTSIDSVNKLERALFFYPFR